MTLLPSLFEPRSTLPTFFRRERFSDLEKFLDELWRASQIWPGNGKSFLLDVQEQDDKYIVEAELPGVEKKDIDVTLRDRVLTVQVKQSAEEEKKGRNYIYRERSSGSATRSITLPLAASEKDVDATLKEGVLILTVKKELGEKIKKIAIH